jgi:hypothetical protein
MQRSFIMGAALSLAISFSGVGRAGGRTSSDENYLTSAQQVKVGQFITERYPPLANVKFSVAIGASVPEGVALHSFSPEAEAISSKLHDVGFIVVEELIALVDQRTRKIVSVFPRWK